MFRARITARPGPKRFHPRLAFLSGMITLGILGLTAGMFFILPRTADAAFSLLIPHRFRLTGFSNQVTVVAHGQGHTEWNSCVARKYEQLVRSGSVQGLDSPGCPPIPPPRFKTWSVKTQGARR